jgi:hypothetical protein
LLQKFSADHFYNANETSLFSPAKPNGSLSYKLPALPGSKEAMHGISVLCSSNMSGTNKRKLLVTGKTVKPRRFKGINMDSLPVLYYAKKMI